MRKYHKYHQDYRRNLIVEKLLGKKGTIVWAVKALLFNKDGSFLALRRAPSDQYMPGAWDLPGGKIEFGETPSEAVARETMEESGINAQVVGALDFWVKFPVPDVQYIGIVFVCVADQAEVILSEEHDEVAWVSQETASAFFNGHSGLEENVMYCDWDKIKQMISAFNKK
jgi:8-oxo-dGTP diphosphatase